MPRESFFDGTTPPLRWAAFGFLIALSGALLAFALGDRYAAENAWAVFAFCLGATGVGITFVAVVYGMLSFPSQAASFWKVKRAQEDAHIESTKQHDYGPRS